jgi:hypothetical protein
VDESPGDSMPGALGVSRVVLEEPFLHVLGRANVESAGFLAYQHVHVVHATRPLLQVAIQGGRHKTSCFIGTYSQRHRI